MEMMDADTAHLALMVAKKGYSTAGARTLGVLAKSPSGGKILVFRNRAQEPEEPDLRLNFFLQAGLLI